MELSSETATAPGFDPNRPFAFVAGQRICESGSSGPAWRLRQGVVRLDATKSDAGQSSFASLAITGDILGCETLISGAYTFTAIALTSCVLTRWPEGESSLYEQSLLESLATSQRRAADIATLRGGQAVDRIIGLIGLLSDTSGNVVLPTRRDIADITDLRFETVSRIIKSLERSGVLVAVRIDGVPATRAYAVALTANAIEPSTAWRRNTTRSTLFNDASQGLHAGKAGAGEPRAASCFAQARFV
jgi:CRP-like cAMP-binding protein